LSQKWGQVHIDAHLGRLNAELIGGAERAAALDAASSHP